MRVKLGLQSSSRFRPMTSHTNEIDVARAHHLLALANHRACQTKSFRCSIWLDEACCILCRSDTASSSESESPDMPMNSTICKGSHQPQLVSQNRHSDEFLRKASSTLSEASLHVSMGSLLGFAMVTFSVYFPFILAPVAASETYHTAFYQYDAKHHAFDNTAWTYGTDYFLALSMALLMMYISTSHSISQTLAWRSRGLLACYMMSVMAGGIAHQFYTTLEQRNTTSFRILWTVCVGTVTAASSFMGPIGSELAKNCQVGLVPFVPEWFWWAYGLCATGVCVYGGLSFQRPACDIFIAGITQFPSTFYVMSNLWLGLPTSSIPRSTRLVGIVGFILNAPLLPLYPLLVQYTDWSLASINTLLHMWLLSAWSLQGLTLSRIVTALARDAVPPPQAIPMKHKKIS